MLKITTSILALVSLIALTPTQAREWTSSDGSKSFPADFISYNSTTKTVTVMKGFKKVSFNASKLSESDQTWLTEQANIIGDKIKDGILSKLSGTSYKHHTLKDPMPEYYLIHFSASW